MLLQTYCDTHLHRWAQIIGYSDVTIGAIVGHKGRTITSRYIHSADAVLLSAADAIADQTAALMAGSKRVIKVIPFRREST